MSATVRTFLVTGPPPFTSRIAHALLARPEVEVVGRSPVQRFGGGEVEAAAPEVLLIDTGLGPAEDVGLVRRARERHPRLPVAVGVPEGCPEAALGYLHGRADGYLCRGASGEELVEGLRRLRRGETVSPPALVQALFERLREGPAGPATPCPLSRREREVLGLLAAGLLNKEIASRLGISPCTVKNHIHKVLGKLQASHRRDAVHRASRHGLLGAGPLGLVAAWAGGADAPARPGACH
jgi:DNA-binding NarL/FixJ family response regulator